MTLRDLLEHADGARWRERRAWERQAWLASILLQAWVKNAPSAKELLGDSMTPDAAEVALESLTGTAAGSLAALDAAYVQQAQERSHGRR